MFVGHLKSDYFSKCFCLLNPLAGEMISDSNVAVLPSCIFMMDEGLS